MIFRLIALSISFVHLQSAFACEHGSLQELETTWKAFRKVSIERKVDEIAKFYRFPLKMKSPLEGSMPLTVTKEIFKKNYDTLFIEAVPHQPNEIYVELKTTRDDDVRSETRREFLNDGCSHVGYAHIFSYEFRWRKDRGWYIDSIFTADYDALEIEFNSGGIKK